LANMETIITTIIVNYNSAKLTERAVRSVHDNHVPGYKHEIIVVDNTATESERTALESSISGLANLIVNKTNIGFGSACNIAYEQSHGKYIMLLNPDAFLDKNALSILINYLSTHPDVGAISPSAFLDNNKTFFLPSSPYSNPLMLLIEIIISKVGILQILGSRYSRVRSYTELTRETPYCKYNLSGGHVLISRDLINRIGGLFDPRFFLYYEDTDMFLRIQKLGYKLYILPDAKVVHNYNQCTPVDRGSKNRYMAVSFQQFLHKYDHSGILMLLLQPVSRLPYTSLFARRKIKDLGILSSPPQFNVPQKLQSQWILEFGPNLSFTPAALKKGRGPIARIDHDTWKLLKPGQYYARLGGLGFFSKLNIWQWVIE